MNESYKETVFTGNIDYNIPVYFNQFTGPLSIPKKETSIFQSKESIAKILSQDMVYDNILKVLFNGPLNRKTKRIDCPKFMDIIKRLKAVSNKLTKDYIDLFMKRIILGKSKINDPNTYNEIIKRDYSLYRNISNGIIPLFDKNPEINDDFKIIDILTHNEIMSFDGFKEGWNEKNGIFYNNHYFIKVEDGHECSRGCVYSGYCGDKNEFLIFPLCKRMCKTKFENMEYKAKDIYKEIFMVSIFNQNDCIEQETLTKYYSLLTDDLYKHLKNMVNEAVDGNDVYVGDNFRLDFMYGIMDIMTDNSIIYIKTDIDNTDRYEFILILINMITGCYKDNINYIKILSPFKDELIIYDINNIKKDTYKLLIEFIELVTKLWDDVVNPKTGPEELALPFDEQDFSSSKSEDYYNDIKDRSEQPDTRDCFDNLSFKDRVELEKSVVQQAMDTLFGSLKYGEPAYFNPYDNPDFDYTEILNLSFNLVPIKFCNIKMELWDKLFKYMKRLRYNKNLVNKVESKK